MLMKTIEISKGGTTAVKIELHDPELQVVVHEVVKPKQIKPHQFEEGKRSFVECTPEQRAEVIRIAQEYEREVYKDTPNSGDDYPNLVFRGDVCGIYATPKDAPYCNWIPFDEFVARLKGEWVEPQPEQEVVKPKQIKPHQFEEGKGYCVECTPGQRAEITRIAEEYGREIYKDTPNSGDDYPNLGFWGHVCGTYATPEDDPHWNWIPFNEFVARLKGEWVEPKEIRIPFDASRMAEAIRFETRDGREVKCVVVNDIEIIRYITGFPDGFSNALTWDKNGRHNQHIEIILDLFMVVKEVRND